jgi:phenylpropionate dioxygenase-like ring-hydroxylating dioxygenase large terminal subunit
MIPNQWYAVLESSEVGRRPVSATRMGEKLVFWRDGEGRVACLRDRCVHRGASLGLGKTVHGRLQCPFHGFEYDASGRVTRIPANGRDAAVPDYYRVVAYPAREAHGFVWIFWGERADPAEPTFFDDLGAGFSYASFSEVWPVHYSRAIENQLDVVHLPFVHQNTIGRGDKTLVDGPVVKWIDENAFMFFVYNRVDDGTPARLPAQMPPPDLARDFHLTFRFPNLWQNYLGDRARVVAAFAPVDEHHTRIYIRFYQSFFRVPVLKRLVNRLMMPVNRIILHQDRRVVSTQVPDASALRMDEKLIPGDLPIVEFRRRRDELIRLARNGE